MSNFHPLEVVGRGSETQLQVGGNLNKMTYTRSQINLYRMFFVDFSVNSQPISMEFCKDYFRVQRRRPWNFHQKIL